MKIEIKNPANLYKHLFKKYENKIRNLKDGDIKLINKKSVLTINTPLYATILNLTQNSEEAADKVHELILLEAQHILFLDDYYEKNLIEKKKEAKQAQKILLPKLNREQKKKLLNLEKKLFSY